MGIWGKVTVITTVSPFNHDSFHEMSLFRLTRTFTSKIKVTRIYGTTRLYYRYPYLETVARKIDLIKP